MTEEMLPRLYERDIDVLLSEELIFNEGVRRVFATALQLPDTPRVTDCRLSVVDATGETDVLATFSLGDSRGVLLIENKIDALFQPRQPERYRERALALASSGGRFEMALCALVAPKAYAREGGEAFGHFDAVVAYEDIAAAIESEGTPRARHRAALLLRAVEQARNAYVLIPAPEVTSFWHRIHRIASREFPALGMKQPNDKGSNSSWVIFKGALPLQVTIDWKITKATVDLSFWQGAARVPPSTMELSDLAACGAGKPSIQTVGQTRMIRVPISPAPAEFVHMDDDTIREALRAALALHGFYQEREGSFA